MIYRTTTDFDGRKVNIYDKERTLIELIRLKEKYPPEVYYDVLNSFKRIKDQLDFFTINEYCKYFSNGESILQRIKELI